MNKKVNLYISFVLLIIILIVMYVTPVGVPGITQYFNDFKLLDMQFNYSADTVSMMLENIGVKGIQHYLYYFIVDFFFIVILLNIQMLLSKVCKINKIRIALYILAVERCCLDLLEDILLSLILKGILSLNIVSIASVITSFKLICLIVWIFLITVCTIKKRKTNLNY